MERETGGGPWGVGTVTERERSPFHGRVERRSTREYEEEVPEDEEYLCRRAVRSKYYLRLIMELWEGCG